MRHDLRTRVGIGKGYASMLLRHFDAMSAEQRAAALHGLSEAFDRLDEFSRRVLLDEQLETSGARPQRGDTAVEALLDDVRTAYPDVVVDVAPGTPETVEVDPVMVREILDNLVANAVAAGPPVRLRACASGASLRIEVRDAGPGISWEDRAVLFQRYGRTESTHRRRGMGLGLSIVRRFVDAHGGTYGVDGGPPATFWVELPVTPAG